MGGVVCLWCDEGMGVSEDVGGYDGVGGYVGVCE